MVLCFHAFFTQLYKLVEKIENNAELSRTFSPYKEQNCGFMLSCILYTVYTLVEKIENNAELSRWLTLWISISGGGVIAMVIPLGCNPRGWRTAQFRGPQVYGISKVHGTWRRWITSFGLYWVNWWWQDVMISSINSVLLHCELLNQLCLYFLFKFDQTIHHLLQ